MAWAPPALARVAANTAASGASSRAVVKAITVYRVVLVIFGDSPLHVPLAEALDYDPPHGQGGKIPAFRINEEFRFDPAAVRLALSNNARTRE